MADNFVEEETALEKGQLRQLFERFSLPTDGQIAAAKNTLNSRKANAKEAMPRVCLPVKSSLLSRTFLATLDRQCFSRLDRAIVLEHQ